MDRSRVQSRRYGTVKPSQALVPLACAVWVFGFIWYWTDGLSNMPPEMRDKVLGSAALGLVFICVAIYQALRVDDVIFITDTQQYRRRRGWWRHVNVWEGDASAIRVRQTSYWRKHGGDFDDVLVCEILFEFPGGQPPIRIQPDHRDRRLTPKPRDAAAVCGTAFKRIIEEIGAAGPKEQGKEGVKILPPAPIPKSPMALAIERGPSPIERFVLMVAGLFFTALGSGMAAIAWIKLLIPSLTINAGGGKVGTIVFGVIFTLGCGVATAAGLGMIYGGLTRWSGSGSESASRSKSDRT